MFLRSALRWPWAVPLLCLALCGAAAAQDLAEAPPQADPALQQALDAYAQGRWAEAAAAYALVIQGYPASPLVPIRRRYGTSSEIADAPKLPHMLPQPSTEATCGSPTSCTKAQTAATPKSTDRKSVG